MYPYVALSNAVHDEAEVLVWRFSNRSRVWPSSLLGDARRRWSAHPAAVDVWRKFRAAEAGPASEEEVVRQRLLADTLYHAAVDFQLIKLGQAVDTTHSTAKTEGALRWRIDRWF